VAHEGRLFLAWTARGNNRINVAVVTLFANTAGAFGIEGLEQKVVLEESSSDRPALATMGRLLYVAWRAADGKHLTFRISGDGTFRTARGWQFLTTSRWAPTRRSTAPRPPVTVSPLVPPLTLPVANIGFVHAMEVVKGGMDFAQYEALTRSRNTGLPVVLPLGRAVEFHAADGRRFSILFQFAGDKYRARIIDLAKPDAVRDYATLPLVSGDFMNAPGGHDGQPLPSITSIWPRPATTYSCAAWPTPFTSPFDDPARTDTSSSPRLGAKLTWPQAGPGMWRRDHRFTSRQTSPPMKSNFDSTALRLRPCPSVRLFVPPGKPARSPDCSSHPEGSSRRDFDTVPQIDVAQVRAADVLKAVAI
jgi:hypothetical protein